MKVGSGGVFKRPVWEKSPSTRGGPRKVRGRSRGAYPLDRATLIGRLVGKGYPLGEATNQYFRGTFIVFLTNRQKNRYGVEPLEKRLSFLRMFHVLRFRFREAPHHIDSMSPILYKLHSVGFAFFERLHAISIFAKPIRCNSRGTFIVILCHGCHF